jgi:hypothetical protein
VKYVANRLGPYVVQYVTPTSQVEKAVEMDGGVDLLKSVARRLVPAGRTPVHWQASCELVGLADIAH